MTHFSDCAPPIFCLAGAGVARLPNRKRGVRRRFNQSGRTDAGAGVAPQQFLLAGLAADLRAPIPRGAVWRPIRAHVDWTAAAFFALETPAKRRNFDGVR